MSNQKNILVAEDDLFIRKIFEMNFIRPDWNVTFVINGVHAIEYLEHTTPDLLLLDLLMPIKNGFDVLDFVRTQNLQFPIYILSNLSQEIDKAKAKELGALDYLVKSDLDIDELVILMEKTMKE